MEHTLETFKLGERCEIHSLQSDSAQHLNGKQVTIVGIVQDKGRYRCKLLRDEGLKTHPAFNAPIFKNIKPSNLMTELKGRLAFYVKVLQKTNESEELIDEVLERASNVNVWGMFDLPKGMGIPYAFAHEYPGVHPSISAPLLAPVGPIGSQVSVVNNVNYLLNLQRKWVRYPNSNPVGKVSSAIIHRDLMTLNSLLYNLKVAVEVDNTHADTTTTTNANANIITTEMYEENSAWETLVNRANQENKTYEPTEKTIPRCSNCGDTNKKLSLCARCKSVFFCSVQCQKLKWKEHKPECNAIRKGVSGLNKKGEAHGSTSKAKALQLIHDVQNLATGEGEVLSFNVLTLRKFMVKREAPLCALHEIGQYKDRKILKWAIKHGVLELWRDLLLQQDITLMRQAKAIGQSAVAMLQGKNSVCLIDLLLVIKETPDGPGIPPIPDLKKMCIFLNDSDCVGFWNLIEMAEIYYKSTTQPAEVQARFIVRQFSKVFAIEKLVTFLLPTLTKKRCQRLTWLSTSFDKNQYDRSGAMQYLAMSIVACLVIQGGKHKELLPKGYNKNKWLYTPKIRCEKIFNGFVMPAFTFAVEKDRLLTQDEIEKFMNDFACRR